MLQVRVRRLSLLGNISISAQLGGVHLVVVFLANLLQSHSLGLRNQERCETSKQHEKSEDLDNVRKETVLVVLGTSVVHQSTKTRLGNNGTNLTGGSRNTVGRRSVSGWETLTWDNESGGVGAKVLKELTQDVESQLTVLAKLVVGETKDTEENGQKDESHKLDWLSTNRVNSGSGNPVAW